MQISPGFFLKTVLVQHLLLSLSDPEVASSLPCPLQSKKNLLCAENLGLVCSVLTPRSQS